MVKVTFITTSLFKLLANIAFAMIVLLLTVATATASTTIDQGTIAAAKANIIEVCPVHMSASNCMACYSLTWVMRPKKALKKQVCLN